MADDDNREDDINIDGGEGEGQPQGQAQKKGGFLSPFLIKILSIIALIILIIVISVITVMVVVNFMKPQSGTALPGEEGQTLVKEEHLATQKFEDPFRQQLLDGKMLQMKIAIGFKAKDKRLQAELSELVPEMRDIIIKYLSRLSSDYFADPNESSLDRLEAELLKQINRIVLEGKVERIYFMEFTLM